MYSDSNINPRNIKLVIIAVCILLINSLYLYENRSVYSGFFYSFRLPILTEIQATQDVVTIQQLNTHFKSFMYAPFFITIISRVTSSQPIEIIYWPIVNISPLFIFIAVFKQTNVRKYQSILLGFVLVLFRFGKQGHITEYSVGKLLFPAVALCLYLWFRRNDNRFFVASLLLYMPVKFLSPHAEVWVLSFVFLFILFQLVLDEPLIDSRRSITLLIILSVLYFSINPKFYEGVLTLGLNFDLINNFQSFLTDFSFTGDLDSPYYANAYNPKEYVFLSGAYYITIALAGIVSGLIYIWYHFYKEIEITVQDVFAFTFGVALLPDFLVLLGIGLFQFEIVAIVGIVTSMHFLSRVELKLGITRLTTVIVIILIVLSTSGVIVYYAASIPYDIGSTENNEHTAVWVSAHADHSESILTDLNTYGILRSNIATVDSSDSYLEHTTYTPDRYRYLIGLNGELESRYIVINRRHESRSLQKGPPTWNYFQPVDQYQDHILANERISVIYNSGDYEMYFNY